MNSKVTLLDVPSLPSLFIKLIKNGHEAILLFILRISSFSENKLASACSWMLLFHRGRGRFRRSLKIQLSANLGACWLSLPHFTTGQVSNGSTMTMAKD